MQSGFRDFLKTNKNCRQDFQDFVYNEQTNDARIFKDLKKTVKVKRREVTNLMTD